METDVFELLKQLKDYGELGAFVGLAYLGMRWHERLSTKWLESIKEIGKECHEAHEKVTRMYDEQTKKANEVAGMLYTALGKLDVRLEELGRRDRTAA